MFQAGLPLVSDPFLMFFLQYGLGFFMLIIISLPFLREEKWDLVNAAVLGLEKCMKSLGFVLMKDQHIIKYAKLLFDGEEGCCPPEKVLWTSFNRGIVGMGDIIPKMLLCGCHHTDDIYRFITPHRKFKIVMTSLKVRTELQF